MRKAIWLSEYSIIQTKTEVENGSLFNLSGGIARQTSIQVREVMDKVIWNQVWAGMRLERYELHIRIISSILTLLNSGPFMKRKVIKWEAFIWGLLTWGSSPCLPCLANLRQTQTWRASQNEKFAIWKFLNKCPLLKQIFWFLTDHYHSASCEHCWLTFPFIISSFPHLNTVTIAVCSVRSHFSWHSTFYYNFKEIANFS